MKKVGIVFPGQGSQRVGMGKALYDRFDYVRTMFHRADEVLGYPLTNLCFNGPDEDLRQTYNTQPSLLLLGYVVWSVFQKETGLVPRVFAGHSLGEYTALLASGFFRFDDALSITRKRGLLMEDACPKGKGGMAALIGADMAVVEPLLAEISHGDYVVVPANLNSPDQVVLSGDAGALKEAVERLKGAGYKKAVFLNVSGPFHSPLMREAAEKLKGEMAKIDKQELSTPVVCNVDANSETNRDNIADKLYRQMFSPVRWEMSVRKMADMGVEVFVEVGPGKVLSNLIKRTLPGVSCYNVEEFEDIETVKGAVL